MKGRSAYEELKKYAKEKYFAIKKLLLTCMEIPFLRGTTPNSPGEMQFDDVFLYDPVVDILLRGRSTRLSHMVLLRDSSSGHRSWILETGTSLKLLKEVNK